MNDISDGTMQLAAVSEPIADTAIAEQITKDLAAAIDQRQLLVNAEQAIMQLAAEREQMHKNMLALNAKLNDLAARNGVLSQHITQQRDEMASVMKYAHMALIRATHYRKRAIAAERMLWFPLSFIYRVIRNRALPLADDATDAYA
jgi:hypothetical protein